MSLTKDKAQIKHCHICDTPECDESGNNETELTKCDTCEEIVCADSESCSEKLGANLEFTMCKKCIGKAEKCNCNICINKETENCPMDKYDYVYDCPGYDPEEEK